MEEINNFQQEPDENLYQAWERFKELLMKCPQHYLIEMHEVILFYNGLGIPTRPILDSRAIQAQLNNVGREIKKVNEKVYAAQVGCEQCKGPHYTKDFPLKEERKTLEEAYYAQSMEDTLSKFMSESAKRHEEKSNLIKEIQASTDAAIRNKGASIKTLEIQIGEMSKVLDIVPPMLDKDLYDSWKMSNGTFTAKLRARKNRYLNRDDPIAYLNKAMDFLTHVASSRFPSITINLELPLIKETKPLFKMAESQCNKFRGDKGKVILVLVCENLQSTGYTSNATSSEENNARRLAKTEDLDTYDSDCDDISNAKAVLMANISNYGFDVISEVPHSETYLNDMENQDVQAMQDFEQIPAVDFTDNEIHSDSNIIPYSQYLQETQQENVQDTHLQAQQDSMILCVIEQMINHVNNWEKANKEQNNESVTAELERYKEREKLALKEQVDSLEQNISKQIKENECLLQTFTVFKSESKEKEDRYMENEIDLEKKIKELDNILFKVGQSAQTVHMLTKPQAFYDNIHKQALGYQNPFYLRKAQRIKPTLYYGIVISDKHVAMPVIDDEETLILEEKSRSKMSEKAKDPEVINNNISHKPIDYEKLNRLSEDFRKRFTPQQEMDAEQAFWFCISNPTIESYNPPPVKVEVPSELPKVSLVNASLKKLKFHLAQFDSVVKKRTTLDARTEGEWGFEHTKAVFNNEIIPFLKSLKDIFNVFDRDLLNKIMEVQTVFDQIDAAVQQFSVDKQCLEIAKKELFLENDRLLQQIMSQDVLLTVMNSMSLIGESVNMDGKRKESCNLEAELLKSQNAFNDLLKRYSQLERHCISLESSIQLNQAIFQKDESCDNQNALEISEFFKNNDLKAQLQDKDSTICKLKDIIKSMREKSKEENVNYDYCEIETKNVELENSVAKLLSENKRLCNEINHVKQVFKEQFDSIKKTRVRTKEQSDSLIDKLDLKSAENEDLKAQIQDKVFVITSLKNDLRNVKGKEIVDIAAQIPFANTIVPGMFKLDLEPLAPRLLQNRDAHIDYLKYTQEQADILWEIVEQAKATQPLDKELDFACKHAQRIQELLICVKDTCPNAVNLSAKKVAVTPNNKVKKIRFAEPLTSSSNIKQVESSKTSDSNTHLLSSTGLKCSTSK
ncbi:hypothetical protein Tco_0253097 [Tanacetum coccineum]